MKFEVIFLSHTRCVLSAQQPHGASGHPIGQDRYRTFLSSQKVLLAAGRLSYTQFLIPYFATLYARYFVCNLKMKLNMSQKYYLNFFFLSPFKMGNLLLCQCILIAIIVICSYTNYSLCTIWGNLKTQKGQKIPQR